MESNCVGASSARRRAVLALLIAAPISAASAQELRARASEPGSEVQFEIPAQPLAAALRAYGNATGLEVFYDGALSVGHRSTAVIGMYTPMLGLKTLLRGTGYVARATDIANTITIVNPPPSAPLLASFDRYQPYFAVLQGRLSAALCHDRSRAGDEVTFRFWLDTSGAISSAELLGSDGSEAWRRDVVTKVQGLQIGKRPPTGLPQPLTMVIYPPSADDTAGCFSSGRAP